MYQQLAPTQGIGDIDVDGSLTGQNIAIGHGARVIQVIQQVVAGMPALSTDYATRVEHFLREYLGTDERPVPFGGRADDLRLLNKWIESKDSPPYLMLAAPAGRGKSALLVQWHTQLLARTELAVTFFPISVRFRTNLAGIVFPTLASRLAALHGEQLTITPDTPLEVWREFLAAYLARPLPDGRHHLLLLDGLDEAADWQATADLFPATPPAGLRVLVTARYLAGDTDVLPWLRRLGWETPGRAHTIELGPLSQAGVTEVLQRHIQTRDHEDMWAAFARELHRLSEGDPLLVRLYLDHLREQRTEMVRLQPEDLHTIRPGLAGYFDRWWQDQRKLWGQHAPLREPAVQVVLNLLACALGPLSQEALLALAPPESGLSTWILEETLLPLQRFVLGDGRQQGYTFSHPRLGQYFYEQLSLRERQAAEARFLSWGQQTVAALNSGQMEPEQVPHYLIQYYGAHLARADANADALLALVSHGWQQVWEGIEGAHAGFLDDTARAWRAAEQADEAAVANSQPAPYLGDEVRCALCRASINSMAKHLPAGLLLALVREGLWTPTQGLAYARQVPEARQRAQVLVELACLVEGSLQAELAHEALKAIQAMGNTVRRTELLAQLLPCLPHDLQQQQLRAALDAARANTSLTDRSQMLLALAPVLASPFNQQLIQEALDSAREIAHPTHQARVFAALVPFLPEATRGSIIQLTLDVTSTIEGESSRAQILATLAPVVPDQFHRVLLLATQAIQSQPHRVRVLVALAPRLADEMKRQVFAAVQAIRSREDRLPLLMALAATLPADTLQGLFEASGTIAYSPDRARLLSALAPHLPEHLQHQAWQLAWEAAKAITHEANRARTMASLAPELGSTLRHQALREALQAVRAIWDTSNRTQAAVGLVPMLSETSQQEVLSFIQTLSNGEERVKLLVSIAPILSTELRQQVLPNVLTETLAIRSKEERLHLLAQLAPALPEPALRELFGYAQGLKDEASRASLLIALAPLLPNDLKRDLLHYARTLKHELNRAQVLVALAGSFPDEHKQAWLEATLRAIRTIKNEMSQASLLTTLAPGLPDELHDQTFGAALDQALALRNESYQAQVLTTLAPALPANLSQKFASAAQEITYGPDRARVLAALVPALPDELKEQVLQETLAAAQTIKEESSKYELLTGLAAHLPGNLMEQLFASILAMKQESRRVELLLGLAPALPAALLQQVLPIIQAITNESKRAEALAALSPHLARLPAPMLCTFWNQVLHTGAQRTRRSLLADLAALFPVITVLGEHVAADQVFQSIRDVGQWWP
jgi:hypothetical protein